MPTTIKDLSNEVLIQIFMSLDGPCSVARLARTCRFFNDIWKEHGSFISLSLLPRLKMFDAGPFDLYGDAVKVATNEFTLEGRPNDAENGVLLARQVMENTILVNLIADDLNEYIWASTRGIAREYFQHPQIDWTNPQHTKFCISQGIYQLWAMSGYGKRTCTNCTNFRSLTFQAMSQPFPTWIPISLLPELYLATRKRGDPHLLGF